ncbi:MAG: hypothetical protein QM487_15285 [Candidatus Marithrix sp.]
MFWKNLPGYFNSGVSDQPRLLTNDEIKFIVSHFKLAPAADRESSELNRSEMVKNLVNDLSSTKMAPSAIPDLIKEIERQHTKSIVAPGSTVGATSAEAVAGSSTQMTLNTFHHSGSADSVSSGIKSIQNLVYARENIKNEKCTIYFEKFLTYEEVLNARSYIVGSVIKDFVKDYIIDYPNELPKFFGYDHTNLIFNKNIEDDRQVLRLFLDTTELYKHRVTLAKIASQLESDMSKTITTIFSSMAEGIIDIYINRDVVDAKIETKDKKDISKILENVPDKYRDLAFFTTIILPELSKIRIKGVLGITKLYPIIIPIVKMIGTETKEEDLWNVKLNINFMRAHGVTSDDLTRLFELAKLIIIEDKQTSILVQVPEELIKGESSSPSFIVNQQIRASKDIANERIRASHDELIRKSRKSNDSSIAKTPVIIERDEIIKASELVIAETKGSNLRELLALRGVDKTRSTCNNMFVMANIFGIETARIFFIKELGKIISDAGSYINPINIMLLSEIIMNTGIPSGTNYAGISRQNVDHLTQATIERAGKTFIKSALHSRTESTDNTTAAIIMGSRGKFGTGFTNIGYDITENGKVITIVNDEIDIAHYRDDDYQEAIPEADDIFGNGDVNFSNLDEVLGDVNFSNLDEVLGDGITEPKAPDAGAVIFNFQNPDKYNNLEPRIDVRKTIISGHPLAEAAPPRDTELIPILSTGLVSEVEEYYPPGDTDFLNKITNLMNAYRNVGMDPTTFVADLPSLDDSEMAEFQSRDIPDQTEVTDLQPIDTDKIMDHYKQ